MTDFVLVSCSKSKLDGTHRGEDLYEPSDIFGKRRTFAEREGVHWGILSAKHGYLRTWQAAENYERHISDRTPVWGAFVLNDLLADLEFFDVDQVTVLAGKRYVDPLVAELEARGYDVLDYNRGLRPGERKRALKQANAPGEQSALTDGGFGKYDTEINHDIRTDGGEEQASQPTSFQVALAQREDAEQSTSLGRAELPALVVVGILLSPIIAVVVVVVSHLRTKRGIRRVRTTETVIDDAGGERA